MAYSKLRECILSAGVLPGAHLAEVECGKRFELSRFAIREGLKRLHGEGLVIKEGNKYRVSTLNAEEVRQISHLRAILEAGAIRFLTKPLSAKSLKEIRRAADDYASLVKKEYFAGAREADLRFHRLIVACAENPRLSRVYEASNLPLLQVTVGTNSVSLNDFDLALREHEKICCALEQNDFEHAARALEKHLKRGEREVLGQ
ncbi:MAG: GntR family transcriptional regulator [Chthoniobacterales bacterium]